MSIAGGPGADRAPGDGTGHEPRLTRPRHGRVLVGVCAGLADHLRVPVSSMRWAMVVLSLVGGAGVAAYLLLWALTPAGDGPPSPGEAGPAARGLERLRPALLAAVAGAVLLVSGVVLAFGDTDSLISASTLFPALAIAAGAVIAWSHLEDDERRVWMGGIDGDSRRGLVRIVMGSALAVSGIVVLATRGQGVSVLWDVAAATVVVVFGLVIVLAPWGLRFWNRLQHEQASRAREQERADIAAHLHDSVLQTLALIQRTEDPARVARLARAQERELRSWLYGGSSRAAHTLAAAVTEAAHDVEDLHGVPIELVVIGDRALDDAGRALVAALREALLNAARHGAPPVSAYLEVGGREVTAYVRDHGPGFDLRDVPEDRLGVRESIVGRMARHGGTARLRRLDVGTEVCLTLPSPGPEPHDGSAPGRSTEQSPPLEPRSAPGPAGERR